MTARTLMAALAMAAALGMAGCVGVKPWERGTLADYTMRADRDPLADMEYDHVYFTREGASGGRGVGGGGSPAAAIPAHASSSSATHGSVRSIARLVRWRSRPPAASSRASH